MAQCDLPQGFVYAKEALPNCREDAKYAGNDNFLGRPVAGYERNCVVLSQAVAEGLKRAEPIFAGLGYGMLLYDSYRPQRAVDDFVAWGKDVEDQARKQIHYPRIEKADMFRLGYVAVRSGHSRGCAVDLTLVDLNSGEPIDMDGWFDLMDDTSGYGAEGVSETGAANRALLRRVMEECGFRGISGEWWHFIIQPEPFPDQYFDFPIV